MPRLVSNDFGGVGLPGEGRKQANLPGQGKSAASELTVRRASVLELGTWNLEP